jgi:hypothetical protein
VGKDANLTVLEKSPYEVEPKAVKDIVVWGTMLEGRLQPAPAAPKVSARVGPDGPGRTSIASGDNDVTDAIVGQMRRLLAHSSSVF